MIDPTSEVEVYKTLILKDVRQIIENIGQLKIGLTQQGEQITGEIELAKNKLAMVSSTLNKSYEDKILQLEDIINTEIEGIERKLLVESLKTQQKIRASLHAAVLDEVTKILNKVFAEQLRDLIKEGNSVIDRIDHSVMKTHPLFARPGLIFLIIALSQTVISISAALIFPLFM